MNKNITWHPLERDEVPSFLEHGVTSLSPRNIDNTARACTIEAALITSRFDSSQLEPALLVVEESAQVDFFSWLNTYSPDTHPITQTIRIIGNFEFQLVEDLLQQKTDQKFDSRWSNIILGEILAQGDADQNISDIPLSRYLGCFTTTLARASAIYKSDEAITVCARRLVAIEQDKRFVARNISAADTVQCWSFFERNKHRKLTSEYFCGSFIRDLFQGYGTSSNFIVEASERYLPELLSESIEKRVIAFNNITKTISSPSLKDKPFIGAIFAASALLVGRGTSHIGLLKKIAKDFPSSLMWFGTLSALSEYKNHDMQWKRTSKSIDRLISDSFDIREQMHSDIGWAEYSWIHNYANDNSLSDIPNLYPRTLSIEILPGSSCQFRLTAPPPAKLIETATLTAEKLKEIERGIEDLISLALKVKSSVSDNSYSTKPVQGSLLPTAPDNKQSKVARPTKSRASSKNRKI
ncbi:hypothetical protein AX279_24425 [Pseudomonas sp. J237]|nr:MULTISPECIES: hypothetical protein [Pseudomonas]OEO23454.1 hypothetical protein AX279_24425 [Pseudomonas sp. J237]